MITIDDRIQDVERAYQQGSISDKEYKKLIRELESLKEERYQTLKREIKEAENFDFDSLILPPQRIYTQHNPILIAGKPLGPTIYQEFCEFKDDYILQHREVFRHIRFEKYNKKTDTFIFITLNEHSKKEKLFITKKELEKNKYRIFQFPEFLINGSYDELWDEDNDYMLTSRKLKRILKEEKSYGK